MQVPCGETVDVRVIDVKAPVAVGRAQPPHEPLAQHVHGHFLEPAVAQETRHDHDLRAACFGKPALQRFPDRVGGEILVLQVDVVAGARNRVEVKRLHVTHRLLRVHVRAGARHRHLDVREVGLELRGPRIGARSRTRRTFLPVAARQRVAGDGAHRPRRVPVDRDHRVVERGIGLAAGGAAGIAGSCALVSHLRQVKSKPPTKAIRSSITTIFW